MTSTNTPDGATTTVRTHSAKTTGLAVAATGVAVFTASTFLNWVDPAESADPRTGYETDSLVPFIAFLGIGLVVAMGYAAKRARRSQHRGLTLVSMAVAIAAALQCLAFAINPMGGLERGDDLSAQIGVFVGLVGALIWAYGSHQLAEQVEGDDAEVAHHH